VAVVGLLVVIVDLMWWLFSRGDTDGSDMVVVVLWVVLVGLKWWFYF